MAGRVKHKTVIRVGRRQGAAWQRIVPVQDVPELDPLVVDRMRNSGRASTLKPKGTCYDCGRRLSGERKFCGPCLAKH